MRDTTSRDRSAGYLVTTVTLFTCLLASQSALIAMAPVLADAASDLGVSTAMAGQLRTVTGLTAGVTALAIGPLAGRVGLGRLLLGASGLAACASIGSAAAPTFLLLAVAQVPLGVAVAVLTSVAALAAAEWVVPERRTRVLSWTLVGQPTAWIVGMPLVGALGEHSWRYGWLALPLAAAAVAGILVVRRAGEPPARSRPAGARTALRDATLARWLASELLANTAWAGTLVYAGALFTESYGVSTGLTGLILAVVAAAYVAGNMAGRRLASDDPLRMLVVLAVLVALGDILLGLARTGIETSTVLLSFVACAAGARTLVSSAFGLATPPDIRAAVSGLRASTMQFGYFAGSLAGGAALGLGGYGALGATMGLFFLAAAATVAPRRAALGAPPESAAFVVRSFQRARG